MPQIRVERLDDPRIADYGAVPEPELVRERGLFVAEGRLVVRRVIEDDRYQIESLLLSEAAFQDLGPALRVLGDQVPVYVCEVSDFRHIAGLPIHRGCLALVRRPATRSVDEVVTTARLVVVLEAVANADNVGGVFRNVAAFGADAVLLSPSCCDPLYRKAIRTSMAATLRVPFAYIENWPDGLAALVARRFTLVGLTPHAEGQTLDALAGAKFARLALLVGNEGAGLTAAAKKATHRLARIPIRPEVDSLNLAVATGIALSRLTRQDDL